MKTFVFATNNLHKLEEIMSIVAGRICIRSLADIQCCEDIPETGSTLEENARMKARYVYEKYACDCFADDTGLEVEALGMAPGVFSARYAGPTNHAEANRKKLLSRMQGQTNRKARFRTLIALIAGGQEYLFEGIVEGQILTEERGTNGFGYDSLFVPDGYTQSFAEMDNDTKNRISHRAMATEQLAAFLSSFIS
jgi:XTP/dITP diphosphohydrolase